MIEATDSTVVARTIPRGSDMTVKTTVRRVHMFECSECGFQARADGLLTIDVHQKATGHVGKREIWIQ